MVDFYTLGQAASAIADELYPETTSMHASVAEAYRCKIYDALCAGTLPGIDPEFRLPIDLCRFSAPFAFGGCLVSRESINDWLKTLGNGIQLANDTAIGPAGVVTEKPLALNGVKKKAEKKGNPGRSAAVIKLANGVSATMKRDSQKPSGRSVAKRIASLSARNPKQHGFEGLALTDAVVRRILTQEKWSPPVTGGSHGASG
jgi:hypothetical protein